MEEVSPAKLWCDRDHDEGSLADWIEQDFNTHWDNPDPKEK